MDELNPTPAAIQISGQNAFNLRETAKWARFLSIIGFIFCGLIVVMGFFVGTIFSRLPGMIGRPTPMGIFGPFIGIFYVLFALIYFFPCLYLFRFATRMLRGIDMNDQALVDTSFLNLKSFFKYVGVFTIICLVMYVLALVIIFTVAMTFGNHHMN